MDWGHEEDKFFQIQHCLRKSNWSIFTVVYSLSAEDGILRVQKTQTNKGMLRSDSENFASPLLIPIQN